MNRRTIGWLGAALLTAAQVSNAAEASVDAGVFSKYVWRGQILNNDTVAQTLVTVTEANGFSFSTWANYDLTSENKTADKDPADTFTEVDLTLNYDLPLDGPVGVSVALAEYLYPNGGESSRDATATFSLEGVLSPTLLISYDFGLVDSFYVNLGVSHDFELTENLTLSLAASVGGSDSSGNEFNFGVNKARLNDGQATAALTAALSPTLGVTLSAQYVAMLDSEVRDAITANGGEKDAFVFGLNLSYQF